MTATKQTIPYQRAACCPDTILHPAGTYSTFDIQFCIYIGHSQLESTDGTGGGLTYLTAYATDLEHVEAKEKLRVMVK